MDVGIWIGIVIIIDIVVVVVIDLLALFRFKQSIKHFLSNWDGYPFIRQVQFGAERKDAMPQIAPRFGKCLDKESILGVGVKAAKGGRGVLATTKSLDMWLWTR